MATFRRCEDYEDARAARGQGAVQLPTPTVLDGRSASAYAGPLGVIIEIQELLDPTRLDECVTEALFATWTDLGDRAEWAIREDVMSLVGHYKHGNRATIAGDWPTITLAR